MLVDIFYIFGHMQACVTSGIANISGGSFCYTCLFYSYDDIDDDYLLQAALEEDLMCER